MCCFQVDIFDWTAFIIVFVQEKRASDLLWQCHAVILCFTVALDIVTSLHLNPQTFVKLIWQVYVLLKCPT